MDNNPLTATPTQSDICALRNEFARRLKARMKTYSLTKRDVERRSFDLVLAGDVKRGINRTNLYPLEAGRQLPNKETLETLAKVLKCQPEDLVPNVEVVQETRGRRRIRLNRALVVCKRTGLGLEHCRLQVDAILPTEAAMVLARILRNGFKARGMELEPAGGPTSTDNTPFSAKEAGEILRQFLEPHRQLH